MAFAISNTKGRAFVRIKLSFLALSKKKNILLRTNKICTFFFCYDFFSCYMKYSFLVKGYKIASITFAHFEIATYLSLVLII